MKHVLLSIALGLFFIYSHAQPDAIDFTATDVDGKEYHLFSLLDAGKYVMIKFTSTT